MIIKMIRATYQIGKVNSSRGTRGTKKVAYVRVMGEGTESEVTSELLKMHRRDIDLNTERLILIEFEERWTFKIDFP